MHHLCIVLLIWLFLPQKAFAESVEMINDDSIVNYSQPAQTDDSILSNYHPLIQALSATYMNNPELKAQREALKITDEQISEAVSGFRPNAGLSYSKGRQRTRVGANDWGYDSSTSKGATISQPLFEGGQNIFNYQSAKQNIKAARAHYIAAEQQLLFNAVDAYSNVVEKQSVRDLTQSNVDVLARQLEVTEARFEVGHLTQTDVAQAKARLSEAQAKLIQAQGDLHTAHAAYERITGLAPEIFPSQNPLPTLPDDAEAAFSIAERLNPELTAARHRVKSTDYAARSRKGALLPNVSLNGSLSRATGVGFFGDFDTDSLTVDVAIPLYQSGAEYSKIRAANAQHQQSKFQQIDTRHAIRQVITQSLANFQAALSVITSTQDAIAASQLARDGVVQENDYGLRTILDVLNAEQELFRHQVDLVRAHRVKTITAYQLLAATGQLTARYLQLPVEHYDIEANARRVKWLPAGF